MESRPFKLSINTKKAWGKFCKYCGFSTALLPEDMVVQENERFYCKACYEAGKDKKTFTVGDYYKATFGETDSPADEAWENIQLNYKVTAGLPRVELAQLYGEPLRVDDTHLDIFFDYFHDKIYFRISYTEDDNPWFGTETYSFLSPGKAVRLLNLNGIHYLDGITEKNWSEYFK